jgi:hypothetical protein
MPAVSESSAAPADRSPASDYDRFAEAYTAENDRGVDVRRHPRELLSGYLRDDNPSGSFLGFLFFVLEAS